MLILKQLINIEKPEHLNLWFKYLSRFQHSLQNMLFLNLIPKNGHVAGNLRARAAATVLRETGHDTASHWLSGGIPQTRCTEPNTKNPRMWIYRPLTRAH